MMVIEQPQQHIIFQIFGNQASQLWQISAYTAKKNADCIQVIIF